MTLFDGRARLIPLPAFSDARGVLTPFDYADLPFIPRRVFTVTDAPLGAERGNHAHRTGQQLLVCLRGRIEVLLRAPGLADTIILTPAAGGLFLAPGIWSRLIYRTEGAVLLALASEPYDPAGYIEQPPE